MTIEQLEETVVEFCKFDGGNIIRANGILVGDDKTFVHVKYTTEDGKELVVKFKKAVNNGWGAGVSKSWRLNLDERAKYCYKDTSNVKK